MQLSISAPRTLSSFPLRTSHLGKLPPCPKTLAPHLLLLLPPPPASTSISGSSISRRRRRGRRTLVVLCNSSSSEAELSAADAEWLEKLPDGNKPLYSHSLPCIEAWLKRLGFRQSRDDRAVWSVDNPDWHAHLSLDVTDLHIRYLKSGPGNLEKDVERKFSYALSRKDVENAILGGP